MTINYVAVFLATVVQFIAGFVWYGPLFGQLWGKIHGFDKLSKAVQQKMMKQMGPYYAAQLGVTVVTSWVLSIFLTYQSSWNPYAMAGFFWLGFTAPAQVSAVIFGGTDKKWIVKKIAVQMGGSLLCLELAAAVISLMR